MFCLCQLEPLLLRFSFKEDKESLASVLQLVSSSPTHLSPLLCFHSNCTFYVKDKIPDDFSEVAKRMWRI